MTCMIATTDRVFADELKSLVALSGITITSGGADLVLLDMDAPVAVSTYRKIIRFSRTDDTKADFVRPFLYRELLMVLRAENGDSTLGEDINCMVLTEDTFTATEKRLLEALMNADGKTVSSAMLAETVFGNSECQNELKVYIRHLRQKIEEPQGIRVIETVRGEGYRFRNERVIKTRFSIVAGDKKHGQ